MSFEHRLQHVARNALDASADALAPDVLARLATIRQAALAEAGAAAVPSRWAPRLAMAATLLVAVGVWTQTRVPAVESHPGREAQAGLAQVDAAPVTAQIASAVVVDMALLDDLEFVAWMELDARDDAGGARYEG